jgi:predicted metal-binding membrane protein
VSAIEAALRRERLVTGTALAALVLLAWIYLWRGAGTDMSGLDATVLTLFPHRLAAPMGGMIMSPVLGWASAAAMWWVMMVAMMTPSAAPLVLLYSRVARHSAAGDVQRPQLASPALLVTGYLFVWLLFSLLAATLELSLQRAGLVSASMQWSRSPWLSACVLLAAGAYQLSPLKLRCLTHCRAPVQFLTRAWRPGPMGALIMGCEHGAWCVGCCWLLMALLLVGGVMNLAWIAILALLVLIEKFTRSGALVSRLTGVTLIGWGLATLAV